MVYGYARVSTQMQAKDGNSLEAQEKLLKENGAEEIYSDAFTGTKAHRPELDKLLARLQAGNGTENESLRIQVADLGKKYNELIKKTVHNACGAGRKANPTRLKAQAAKVMDLMAAGKTATEIQEILEISRSTFFKYKKFIKEKDS